MKGADLETKNREKKNNSHVLFTNVIIDRPKRFTIFFPPLCVFLRVNSVLWRTTKSYEKSSTSQARLPPSSPMHRFTHHIYTSCAHTTSMYPVLRRSIQNYKVPIPTTRIEKGLV